MNAFSYPREFWEGILTLIVLHRFNLTFIVEEGRPHQLTTHDSDIILSPIPVKLSDEENESGKKPW